jgi:hypothetical protein
MLRKPAREFEEAKKHMKKKKILLFLYAVVVLIFFNETSACAADNHPASSPNKPQTTEDKLGGRYYLAGSLLGRINPQAGGFQGSIRYRNVYSFSDVYKMDSAYWQTSFGVGISPAVISASVHAEWMPCLFLTMRVQYDYYAYLGTNNALLSFKSPDADYGNSVLKDRNDEETASGHHFLFQPSLQGKIGKVVLRNQTDLSYYRFSGRGPYYWEPAHDILLKDGDFLFANRTFVLYEIYRKSPAEALLAGPYYEVTRADDAHITQQKIGAAVYWTPADSLWLLKNPKLVMVTGYHLQDPNREDSLFLMLGAGFEYSL